jgi:hypothetical protein
VAIDLGGSELPDTGLAILCHWSPAHCFVRVVFAFPGTAVVSRPVPLLLLLATKCSSTFQIVLTHHVGELPNRLRSTRELIRLARENLVLTG